MEVGPRAEIRSALADLTRDEAEETLRAIVQGEVDALVIDTSSGPAVYTLKDANHPYRIIIEQISEGAVVCDQHGTILYSNRHFAAFFGVAKSGLLGRPMQSLVVAEHRRRLHGLMSLARSAPAAAELELSGGNNRRPVYFSASPIEIEGWESCVAVVITDLSMRRRSEHIAAAEEFARAILDQTAEPIIVCDPQGVVSHASLTAQRLCLSSPLGRPFSQAFPLVRAAFGDEIDPGRPFGAADTQHRVEVAMTCRDGHLRHFLASAGPLKNAAGDWVGQVVTLADITEVTRQRAELEQARKAAEEANAAKTHFLAAASHDLRQPFQALRLFLDILTQQLTDPKQQEIAQAASQALSGGEDLLHALLGISQLDAGTVTPEPSCFPLADIMLPLELDCRLPARQKGLELRMVPSSRMVTSDPVLLSRLLRNLLHNAIKYTDQGRVLFGCRRMGHGTRIEVWDSGIGIPVDLHRRIFDDFYQVANPDRDQALGLGIGLSVVQRTAKLLGHKIKVRSWPGKGSVFAVVIQDLG